MKKLFLIITVCFCVMITSCKWAKDVRTSFTYKDPQTIGGKWTVTSINKTYEHLKCIYWGTEDDTAIFENDNGRIYVFSGTMNAIQE